MDACFLPSADAPIRSRAKARFTQAYISAVYGTPVRAAADGIVTFTDMENGYGRLIKIDHGSGIETYYAHLSRFYVQAGQAVRRGEMIGAVGSSGRVTAPHLHYEVRLGHAPVNPYRYLAKSTLFQEAIRTEPF